MSVLFATTKDILSTQCRQTGIRRPKCVGGTIDTLDKALDEIRQLLADGRRWDCGQLYRHSPTAKMRWPRGEMQGRKAIERQLTAHGSCWGITRCSIGIWRKISV